MKEVSPFKAKHGHHDDPSHIIIEKTFEMSKSDSSNDSVSIAESVEVRQNYQEDLIVKDLEE